METLAGLLGTRSAYWMGTLRIEAIAATDPVGGWRPRALRYLNPSKAREAARKEHVRRLNAGAIDPSVARNLEQAGAFRVNIKSEMMPPDWFESEFYLTLMKPLGIKDNIYATMPLGDNVESWFAFERIGEEAKSFGERDRALLEYALRPMKWFHRQLALYEGLILADENITPSEKKVLASLLGDKTEREIADDLGLTQSTVHTYSTRICRKYGVRGRAGLTALWLGEIPEK